MKEDEYWIHGLAVCRVCGHSWVAVIFIDGELSNLECPECHSMSGELESVDDNIERY